MPKRRRAGARGFTLIELMTVVAVVAVLAAVAYPAYREQVRKSRRADAQTVLMQNAQFMERLFTETGCYNPGADNDCATSADAGVTLPHTEAPIDGSVKYYDISVPNLSLAPIAYRLEAAPKGAQAGDPCGTMSLNQVGQKTAAGNDCWRR